MRILLVSGHRGKNWHPERDPIHSKAIDWLERQYRCDFVPHQVWHGGATGVDETAHRMAMHHELDIHVFSARWNRDGRAAGPIRNRRMGNSANAAISAGHDVAWAIMPGGNGTAGARALAEEFSIRILLAPGAPESRIQRG